MPVEKKVRCSANSNAANRGAMIAPTLFEVPAAARRRASTPVRRGSRRRGREGMLWQPFEREKALILLAAAATFDRTHRKTGEKRGPLGQVGLEVLDCLVHFVDFKTGRLDPAIKTIAAYTKRSVSAVTDALKRLRTHGFLDWLRRFEDADCDGKGPQVRQISNAYRLLLPARALALLGFRPQRPPLPDDIQAACEDKAEQERWMLRALKKISQSAWTMQIFTHRDDTRELLGRMAARMFG